MSATRALRAPLHHVDETAAPLTWSFVPAAEAARWVRDWDDLNRRGCRSPLTQSWFLLPALRRFGNGTETVAIGRRGAETPSVMALLDAPAAMRCKGFHPSQAPLAALLLAPGENAADAMRSLIRALPVNVLALTLQHLDERLMSLPPAAMDIEVEPRFETGSIFIGRSFDAYYAEMPVRPRKNLERRQRKAEAELGPIALEVWTDEARIDAFLRLYSDTEQKGWKGAAGTAVGVDDPQGLFYRDLLTEAARRGALRMFVLTMGGRAAAQQIAIEQDGIVYFLKTTYDESLGAYAPGVIQRFMILRWSHAQQPPVRDFEIYGQVKEAIAPFITGTRMMYHLTVFRNGALRGPLLLLRRLRRAVGSMTGRDDASAGEPADRARDL